MVVCSREEFLSSSISLEKRLLEGLVCLRNTHEGISLATTAHSIIVKYEIHIPYAIGVTSTSYKRFLDSNHDIITKDVSMDSRVK